MFGKDSIIKISLDENAGFEILMLTENQKLVRVKSGNFEN